MTHWTHKLEIMGSIKMYNPSPYEKTFEIGFLIAVTPNFPSTLCVERGIKSKSKLCIPSENQGTVDRISHCSYSEFPKHSVWWTWNRVGQNYRSHNKTRERKTGFLNQSCTNFSQTYRKKWRLQRIIWRCICLHVFIYPFYR